VGLLSLIWFLIRVLPKPSRAIYPCQRVAAPLASGFVIWITGLIGSALAYRKARRFLHQSRYVVAGICVVVSVMAVWLSLSVTGEAPATAAFTPSDPPNSPIGAAKGINPGRVVWVHEPGATSWDGSTGRWWDDDSTDQEAVDFMVSKVIQTLTGQTSDPNAWDALFRHFNQARGLGDAGYQAPEKIAIKINMNQENSSGGNWSSGAGNPSPHVICSVLRHLIEGVGVPGSAITIYDASRYIGNPIYDKIRSDPNPDFLSVRFVVKSTLARNGRIGATGDAGNPLHTRAGTARLPRCVTGAKYLINMALLRPHQLFGITLCAKNHFGSTYFPSRNEWTPSPLHSHGGRDKSMNTYNCLVNLNGHRHLSGKTLLYMIDGLYPAVHQSGNVIKWLSFGDDWCSSIFASQDPVAIDSVGLDFLRNEPRCTDVTGNPENYLHEMAQADDPPSGIVYDPENDGTRLASLGVHEHWNNPVEKKYSRNLGTGDGIELVVPSFATADGPIENVTNGRKYDHIRHAISDADAGDTIVVGPGVYYENISFTGKNLTLSSTNPSDPAVVAATVINGGKLAVTFSSGEDANCVLAGFTITGSETAVYCSGASPTITNCRIEHNGSPGIELHNGSDPTITNCEIASNAGAGIELWAQRQGRVTIYNHPTITNCIISTNGGHGISGGMPTIANCTIAANSQCGISCLRPTVTDSLICHNSAGSDIVQIESNFATVTYSNVQGGWPGEDNIDADPLFADPNNGDYHLKSEAGRWDPNSQTWVRDDVTSPCIDAGSPDSDWTAELWPNGKRINIGAYGTTPQASMSLSTVGNIADLNIDDTVDFLDIAHFAGSWRTEQVLLPQDLDRDGRVGIPDLGIFTGQWLWEQ
jgi:parallel beta-helix repeat protein